MKNEEINISFAIYTKENCNACTRTMNNIFSVIEKYKNDKVVFSIITLNKDFYKLKEIKYPFAKIRAYKLFNNMGHWELDKDEIETSRTGFMSKKSIELIIESLIKILDGKESIT